MIDPNAGTTNGKPQPVHYRRPTRVLVAAQVLTIRGALGLIGSLGFLLLGLAFRGEAAASVPSPGGFLAGFGVLVATHGVLVAAGVGLLGARRWSTGMVLAAVAALLVTSVVAVRETIAIYAERPYTPPTELSEFLSLLGWTRFFFIFLIDLAIIAFVAWAVVTARRVSLVPAAVESQPPTDADRRRLQAAQALLTALGVAALAQPAASIGLSAIQAVPPGHERDLGSVSTLLIPWLIPALAAVLTARAVRRGRRWTLAGAPVVAVAAGTWLLIISWLGGGGGNPYGIAGMLAVLGAGIGAAAGLWRDDGRLALPGAAIGALAFGFAGFAASSVDPGFGTVGWLAVAALLGTGILTGASMTSGRAALGGATV